MTNEDISELRKELTALDGLLDKLTPQDDLARLALDPKRQQAAAAMVGTVVLARQLLASAKARLSGNGNGKAPPETRPPATRWGEIGPWLLKQIDNEPVPKADVIKKAQKQGWGFAAVYSAMQKLEKNGSLKSKAISGTRNRQEVWKVG